MTRKSPNYQKEDEVREFLFDTQRVGLSLEDLRTQLTAEQIVISSENHTLQKFKTDSSRRLLPTDLDGLHNFFTNNRRGLHIRDLARKAPLEGALAADRSPSTSKGAALGAARTPIPEPLTGNLRLASIAIQGTQGTSSSILVSFTIACANWGGCAVQRGQVEMYPHPGWVGQDAAGAWALPIEVKMVGHNGSGKVLLTRGFSTPFDPFWEVAGVNMPIGSFTTEGDFALVEGVSAGDRITVTFGTCLGDMDELGEADGIVPTAADTEIDGFAPVNVPVKNEPMVDPKGYKRRLISTIRKSGLNIGPNGYLKLSSCTLELVDVQQGRQR